MYEIFEQLLQKYGLTTYKVSKDTGIGQSTFSNWKAKRNLISPEIGKRLADYFGVSLDYLMTGNDDGKKNESTLTPKDDRDIGKNLEKMLKALEENKDGPLFYNDQELDETSKAFLASAFESALRQMKIINKEKYNPNKNKKK